MLIGIGFIIFMAIFLKVCSVHTPSSNPRKPPALKISETLRRPIKKVGLFVCPTFISLCLPLVIFSVVSCLQLTLKLHPLFVLFLLPLLIPHPNHRTVSGLSSSASLALASERSTDRRASISATVRAAPPQCAQQAEKGWRATTSRRFRRARSTAECYCQLESLKFAISFFISVFFRKFLYKYVNFFYSKL